MQAIGKTEKGRIYWLDFAKVLTAFLVVWSHVLKDSGVGNDIMNYLFAFHVPLFFFISGLFHKDKQEDQWRKYARRLLLPVVIFRILDGVAYAITQAISDGQWSLICGYLFEYCKFVAVSFVRGTDLNPCWFLIALFWCKIFTDFYLLAKRKWLIGAVLFAGLIVPYVFSYRFPAFISQGFMALPFYLLAYYTSAYVKGIKSSWKFLLPAVVCLIGSILLFRVNGKVSMNGFYFGTLPKFLNFIVFYATALIGTTMVLSFSLIPCPEMKSVKLLATALITILGVQSIFLRVIAASAGYGLLGNWTFIVTIFVSIVIMWLCYFVHRVIGSLYS